MTAYTFHQGKAPPFSLSLEEEQGLHGCLQLKQWWVGSFYVVGGAHVFAVFGCGGLCLTRSSYSCRCRTRSTSSRIRRVSTSLSRFARSSDRCAPATVTEGHGEGSQWISRTDRWEKGHKLYIYISMYLSIDIKRTLLHVVHGGESSDTHHLIQTTRLRQPGTHTYSTAFLSYLS